MSKKRRDRAVSSAAEPRAEDPQANEPDALQRPIVRWKLVLCALGMLALTHRILCGAGGPRNGEEPD